MVVLMRFSLIGPFIVDPIGGPINEASLYVIYIVQYQLSFSKLLSAKSYQTTHIAWILN